MRPRRPAAGPIGAETAHAMAEAVLRAGLALVTIVAATDCIFALVAGGGPPAAVEGAVLTGLGLAAVVRVDVATRVLRRRGRVVLVAAAFAAGGILDAGLQDHFAEVAAAFTCVAALICAPRWVALCWLVCAAGFLGALAEEGHSIAWMVGDGRYAAAGPLVNLTANAVVGLLMIALLRRFLVDAPRHLAAVRSGGGSLTPQLALAAGGRPAALLPRADPRELISSLTQAERAVVSLLASGRAPKQVASELSIAVPTVRSRILSARRKTGARTMEQLVCLYAEGGGA